MALPMRRYQDTEDYWRVRALLREALPLNDFRERSWTLYRWDYCRWHVWENIIRPALEDVVFLWEAPAGGLAAVLNIEDPGHVFLQVHPMWRSDALEADMLDVAERHLSVTQPDGTRVVHVWANRADPARQALLERWGYRSEGWVEHQRRRPVPPDPSGVPAVPLPGGYSVRALGDEPELPSRSWASWRAFHPDEPAEQYKGWRWYRNMQRAPLYRRDLDVVAVAPDGAVAAFTTVWFDDVTRTGAFEPVGTVPEHQRKGLGKAVMTEGLRRLALLGATRAYVASTGAAGHALYESMGFTDYELHGPWRKTL